MYSLKFLIPLFASVILIGCSSSDAEVVTPDPSTQAAKPPDTTTPVTEETLVEDKKTPVEDKDTPVKDKETLVVIPVAPSIPVLTLTFTPTKAFSFSWIAVPDAISYKLKEAITVASGYATTPIFTTTDATATSFDHLVPLYRRLNAKYMLEVCNAIGCTDYAEVSTGTRERVAAMAASIGYLKATNKGADDYFGASMSISKDGSTLAVGAPNEDSNSQVIAVEDNNLATNAGAVYVFTLRNKTWTQQAYLKASNAGRGDFFGHSVSLSADGNTLAVGATLEAGDIQGTNGKLHRGWERNNSASGAGAAYVFTRTDTTWAETAYLKASNTDEDDHFGYSVSLSADGNTLAVGAEDEDSNAKGINQVNTDDTAASAGAMYVFIRKGTVWSPQAYIKASNTDAGDLFGHSAKLSADGNTLAVSAPNESSNTTAIGGTQTNNLALNAGAVYVFIRKGTTWTQQAYVKASNADNRDEFGWSVSLSASGDTLAVSAPREDSNARGINGLQSNNMASPTTGAVYVFIRSGVKWKQQAYLKASNTGKNDQFGSSMSISRDGNTLAVSTRFEDSNASGINGNQANNGSENSGAVYTFTRSGTTWSQQAYIKASNTGSDDRFGKSLALSADGGTLIVGAHHEDSNAADSVSDSGAVYVY